MDNSAFYPNDHVLYWQFRASELFSNTISGLIDDRYSGRMQRERHPRYHFWQSQHVADVTDRCYAGVPALAPGPPGRKWHCAPLPFAFFGKRYANYYDIGALVPAGKAWIEPLNADVAGALLANREGKEVLVAYPQVRGRARRTILESSRGLQGEPLGTSASLRWSILPLRAGELRLLGSLETDSLSEGRYMPFLASVLGARNTYLLLWLPVP